MYLIILLTVICTSLSAFAAELNCDPDLGLVDGECLDKASLRYEPDVVTISGIIEIGQGRHPNGTQISFTFLKLPEPVTVGGNANGVNQPERGITEVQLFANDRRIRAELRKLRGGKARVTGKLFHEATDWHMRKILMRVSSFKPIYQPREPYVVITEFPVSKNKIIYVSERSDLCPTPSPQNSSNKWSKRWIVETPYESFSLANCSRIIQSRLAGCDTLFREEFNRHASEENPHDALMLLRLNAKGRIGLLISQQQSGSGGDKHDWILYEVSSSIPASSKSCRITPLYKGHSVEDVGLTFSQNCKKRETEDNCYVRLFHNPSGAYQLQFWEDRVERKLLPADVNWPRSRDRIWQ